MDAKDILVVGLFAAIMVLAFVFSGQKKPPKDKK